jgi:hypothetical protein
MGDIVSKKYIYYYVTEPTEAQFQSKKYIYPELEFIGIQDLWREIEGIERNLIIRIGKDGKKSSRICVRRKKNDYVMQKLRSLGYNIIEISI